MSTTHSSQATLGWPWSMSHKKEPTSFKVILTKSCGELFLQTEFYFLADFNCLGRLELINFLNFLYLFLVAFKLKPFGILLLSQ